jgi:hypothetical protein
VHKKIAQPLTGISVTFLNTFSGNEKNSYWLRHEEKLNFFTLYLSPKPFNRAVKHIFKRQGLSLAAIEKT